MISHKKMTWGTKNIILLLIMSALAIAVFYEYLPDSKKRPESGNPERVTNEAQQSNKASDEQWINKKLYARQLQNHKQIIASKKQIHAAYADIALPYAMQMAELGSFHRNKSMSEEQVQQYIKKMLPKDGSIDLEKFKINKSKPIDDNEVFIASIKLKSYTHQSLFKLLNQWGSFHNGMIWENFSIMIDNKQHFSTLTGRLRIVFIRSIE